MSYLSTDESTHQEVSGVHSDKADMLLVPDILEQLFHLEVGGGIRPYRDQVLERMWHASDVGRGMWRELVHHLEHWEQDVSRGRGEMGKVHYPRTLEDAVRVYGSTALKTRIGIEPE